ncbi:hypothetical protein BDZ45DRAFT_708349 [Acephala macrosclerotiorum]|nr:hypothetical protein BDZ45DRAFT_708349 [Acephala macrosclerotiorum]
MAYFSCYQGCLLFVLASTACAYQKFESTCTKPVNFTGTSFVSSPDTRGTLDILWKQRERRDSGRLGDWKWRLKGAFPTIKWMVITVLAPEVVIGKAFLDHAWAKAKLKEFEDFAARDKVPWTLTHMYFANMGFFVRDPEPGLLCHVDANMILKLLQSKTLLKLPNFTQEELQDRSKEDGLVKAIAIAQLTWSIVQIITRAVKRITISQLELATIAFAACAVIIYLLGWTKPKKSATIQQYQKGVKDDITRSEYLSIVKFIWNPRRPIRTPTTPLRSRFRNDEAPGVIEKTGKEEIGIKIGIMASIVGSAGAILFGGIHVAAWNFAFPTHLELVLWRYTSISRALCQRYLRKRYPPVKKDELLDENSLPNAQRIPLLILYHISPALGLLYIISRLFLLVEIFRSLCFLPPSAYLSTWATNFPHIM